ncbi:tubulin binding cofactor A protein [Besnoitia besnoiti]|uniref:Tubulin-specific chaperone A n=1 Tax=Besnoitia besnoiti TaxID=94643 RepID=A0A2A9M7S3_BESBE|nr:tubulin binding cofactor A protein [Besnoitia besnoiti]PFH31723.1 tubulin binding cofactor A protein [Besnoitia besnoiti]
MATPPTNEYLRLLRIRHKVVQRLLKEVKHYQLEVEQHRRTVARMKAENREPSDIKQQQNVYDETVVMVPDAEQRLLRACADLDDYILSSAACTETLHRKLMMPAVACGADGESEADADETKTAKATVHAETDGERSLEQEVCGIVETAQQLGREVPHLHIQFRAFEVLPDGGTRGQNPESEDEDDI